MIGQAKKYTPQIPNVKTLYIEGMGHDMQDVYLPQIHSAIMENIMQTSVLEVEP